MEDDILSSDDTVQRYEDIEKYGLEDIESLKSGSFATEYAEYRTAIRTKFGDKELIKGDFDFTKEESSISVGAST